MKEIFRNALGSLCLVLSAGFQLKAQHVAYRHLSLEQGLASNEVYQVAQDAQGFMWIACESGLFQYDGFRFRKFRNSTQNGIAVSDIQIDPSNRIWCRNFTGQIYRVQGDSLFTVADVSTLKNASSLFTLDAKGHMWLVAENQLRQYSPSGKLMKKVDLRGIRAEFTPMKLLCFQGSIYATYAQSDVLRFDIAKGKLERITGKKLSDPYNSLSLLIHKNELYVQILNTQKNTTEICPVKGTSVHEGATLSYGPNERIYAFVEDRKQRLWTCTSLGLFRYSKANKSLLSSDALFPNEQVSSVLLDREGSLWVTTLQHGIFIVPNPQILLYTAENSALSETNFTALGFANKDLLMLGSSTGLLSSLNTRTDQITHYPMEIPTVSAKKIMHHEGRTYVAHGPLSWFEYGERKGIIPVFHLRDFCFADGRLYYVHSSSNGYTSLSNVEEERYGHQEFIPGRSVCYNPADRSVYLGLNSGLFIEKDGRRTEIRLKGKPVVVAAMVTDGKTVFAATISNGLLLIRKGKIQRVLGSHNSSLVNELKAVHASPSFVWVSGNSYLYRIDPNTLQIKRFNENQGIYPQDINAMTSMKGTLYLATDRGLMLFPETLDGTNRVVPQLHVQGISVNGAAVSTQELELQHDFSGLTFQVRSACLRGAKDAIIQYRLNPNEAWTSQPLSNSTLYFASLPPGTYQLQIKVINESGSESAIWEKEFTVFAPIYQRWWFYLLLIVLTIVSAGLIFRARIRYIHKKALLKNLVLRSQLTALKAQMNPHFMYNALNSIQALILQKDIENSNLYLSKFSRLMRLILEASGKEYITIREEVDLLELYLDLEKLRFGSDFNYTIHIDDSLDPHSTTIPSVLLQPFVENALKHGLLHKKGKKELAIGFRMEEVLICTIRDNGIGRQKSQEIKTRQASSHASFATEAIHQQLDILNASRPKGIEIHIEDLEENGAAVGTVVTLRIPPEDFGN